MQFDGGEFNWNVLTQSNFLSSLLGTGTPKIYK